MAGSEDFAAAILAARADIDRDSERVARLRAEADTMAAALGGLDPSPTSMTATTPDDLERIVGEAREHRARGEQVAAQITQLDREISVLQSARTRTIVIASAIAAVVLLILVLIVAGG
ncbi:MAG: hypothetical protein QM621_00205 [Aeromicrobium sp.]|uniref:hypothetical protein n=1 Tax=Aeromicrobium sp. TaxID=1871063 RepID=UPI0039E4B9EE